MKKAFIIIVSLFLAFTSFSCVNKKTPTKEEPKQVEKTPEQEPSNPVTPDPKEPDDPTPVTPDEKEPVEPVKPKVKHKITYVVPDYVKVDGLPTEYVEGEGLDTLIEPKVINEKEGDDYSSVFVYWYVYDEDALTPDFSEVVTSISKEETRDFVLAPKIEYLRRYKAYKEKWAIDIKDNIVYPFIYQSCLDAFPQIYYYGKIKIDKSKTPKIIKENNITYYKLYCNIEHIYGNDFLEAERILGNDSYINKENKTPYFIYLKDSKYQNYSSCDEFIINVNNYKDIYDINEETYEGEHRYITFPDDTSPLAIVEKETSIITSREYFDLYPIVDGIVYVTDQSMFTTTTDKPYIYATYRYYFNKNISDNPTVEEFDIWMKECMVRLYERTRYNFAFRGI